MNGVGAQLDLESHVKQIISFPDSSSSSEGVDAILAPIFKDVLEHDAGRKFTERLDAFTLEKVGEIEKMCNSNHQEFVGAVEKLLKARKGAAGLKVQSERLVMWLLTFSARSKRRPSEVGTRVDLSHEAANRKPDDIGEH
jgi:hypothetical protein